MPPGLRYCSDGQSGRLITRLQYAVKDIVDSESCGRRTNVRLILENVIDKRVFAIRKIGKITMEAVAYPIFCCRAVRSRDTLARAVGVKITVVQLDSRSVKR